jgi:hypothetical protein
MPQYVHSRLEDRPQGSFVIPRSECWFHQQLHSSGSFHAISQHFDQVTAFLDLGLKGRNI